MSSLRACRNAWLDDQDVDREDACGAAPQCAGVRRGIARARVPVCPCARACGWRRGGDGARAHRYIRRIEELVECPATWIGVGASRTDMIRNFK